MRKLCLVFAFFVLSTSQFLAEELELKDGSKVTGKLTSIEGNIFHVKTAYGEIQVPRSEVVAIRFPENAPKSDNGSGNDSGASTPIDEKLDGTTYFNRTNHFQASVPATWILAPELRKAKGVVASLKSSDQSRFFMVTQETFSGSLKTYQVLVETQLQATFQDIQKVSETSTKLDGHVGVRLAFKAKKDNTPLEYLIYILPYDNSMVRLSFFTLQPLFDEAMPEFEKIAQSYHSTVDKPVAHLAVPANPGN